MVNLMLWGLCVASLTATPSGDTLAVIGDTAQATATVTNTCNQPDTSLAVTWRSQSPAIATVVSTGAQRARITAVDTGVTKIIATAGSLADTVHICVSGPALDVAPPTLALAPSGTATVTGSVSDCGGLLGTAVTWVSRNTGVATVASAGAQTGTATGVAAGTTYLVGTAGVAKDSSQATVTSATAFVGCTGLAGTQVNVTPSTLQSALNAAAAGQKIVLAAGSYTASSYSWSNRHGTSSNPIVLCGPSTAMLRSLRPTNISWWIFQGFTLRRLSSTQNSFQAFYAKNIDNSKLRGLDISMVDQEAVHFLCNSTNNTLEGSRIDSTGRTKPTSGEAVYFGTYPPDYAARCGTSSPDASNGNQLLGNIFGPHVTSEDLDAKEGTSNGVVRGNTSNGTGKLATSGHFESSIALKGSTSGPTTSGYVVENNTLNPAAQNGSISANGILLYSGSMSHIIRNNTINMQGASGYGINLRGSGVGHTCAASNTVTNGQRSNGSCSAQ